MKTCFSEGKLMKQFGNPPFLKEPPFSTNPPISEQFFHDPPLCPNFENKNPPLNFRRGEETMLVFFNPSMQNNENWPNILYKLGIVNSTRSLKYAWPFQHDA